MKPIERLQQRSGNACELCKGTEGLSVYEVKPAQGNSDEDAVLVCNKCLQQIEKREALDQEHWKVLSDSMWSETAGVQVVAWRMLNRLGTESWANDLIDMMYLDEDRLAWAKASGDHENDAAVDLHLDANGQVLQNGDSIVLTKSLDVKGSTLNAKMGTVVKNIKLVADNTEQVEGKIEGQVIVVLTKYIRKQGN